MNMYVTTLVVVAITALSMVWHLRQTSRPSGSAGEAACGRACPRCRAPLPASAVAECPRCHVPLQAYELVLAPVATDSSAPQGALHALVRADVCVGCGACVAACPEPGAIRLEGKLAVVERALCKGHGECVRACPVNGIALSSGAAVQRVEAPELDVHFQSNVPGLYVVGELGGRGLIKNAINEGRIAVEHIAAELSRDAGRGAAGDGVRVAVGHIAGAPGPPPGLAAGGDRFDVVVVGSGPAGLSAGLEALRTGLAGVVLEQGDLSDTIHRYPRHKLLLAEPVNIPLYGRLWVSDASKESLLKLWRGIIDRTGLDVRTGHRVERIAPTADGFEIEAGGRRFHARRVVLAMGRRGNPRRLGVPGEELPKVFYDIVEMEAFAGQRVLVVGGGDSAIESAVGLATQEGTEVTLCYRGDAFARIKERNRARLDAETARGRIHLLLRSQVREIRPECAVLDVAGRPHIQPNDHVIVRIGGDPPFAFLTALGVRIVTKEVALVVHPTSAGISREESAREARHA
jgi:thioredoxin reductase/Pyruvate/2-oxoacid:ferredoxin oxidoreductase delta subunit